MKNNIPIEKNGIYTMKINGLGSSGEGVGKYEGFTIFIPFALPGETVKVKITVVKKNYGLGKLLKVIEASEARTEPLCPVYYACGGCQIQHLNYEAQLKEKRQKVIDAVERIGKLATVKVHPTVGAENPWHYRNKMQFPVGEDNGQVVSGCYAMGTHKIVSTASCIIQHPLNNTVLTEVTRIIRELGIAPYNEITRQGVVRHIIGRVGTHTDEIMVVLVTAGKTLPDKDRLIAEVRRSLPQVKSIVQNINNSGTNVIMGNESIVLWGVETITDKLGPFVFDISPRSFFQVNTTQAERLYAKAVEYAALTAEDVVLDAYCGTGTITLFLAQQAKRAYGVEYVQEAVDDANLNAKKNGVKNVEFYAGDVAQVMPKLMRQGVSPDVIVVDPPRAGCDKAVIEAMINMNPKRIVYVSCNPASLARDLALLAEGGYIAQEIQPFDMFPQTSHVECAVWLKRKHSP